MKVIVGGGVAGGASCAARLRRLDEHAEIVMVERGPYVSFANCGLPYHVGGVIEHESDLLVANEQVFRGHFAVDCRPGCEAVGIDADAKTVDLRDVASGSVTTESYDTLVLAPGAPLNAQHDERTSADQLISNLGEWRVVGMARSRASSRASSRVPELRD